MSKLSLIVMFCHLLSCPAFAQSPSKGYKAGLSAVIYVSTLPGSESLSYETAGCRLPYWPIILFCIH